MFDLGRYDNIFIKINENLRQGFSYFFVHKLKIWKIIVTIYF